MHRLKRPLDFASNRQQMVSQAADSVRAGFPPIGNVDSRHETRGANNIGLNVPAAGMKQLRSSPRTVNQHDRRRNVMVPRD